MTPRNHGRRRAKPVEDDVIPGLLSFPGEPPKTRVVVGEQAPEFEGLRELVDALTSDAADLRYTADPLDAEMLGATLLSIGEPDRERFENDLENVVLSEIASRGTTEALLILMGTAAITAGGLADACYLAAGKLIESGVPLPAWAAELRDPVTVSGCTRLADDQGIMSMLACTFHRAGRSHALLVTVDHLDCGAATGLQWADAAELPRVFKKARAAAKSSGLRITHEKLETAEFRWQLENALAIRATHDAGDFSPNTEFQAMAVLTRARLRFLPLSGKPLAPHSDLNDLTYALPLLPQRELPAKRKKADGPAPVYQLKISLRGAKPPIWRRLEVPADIDLARLHRIVQIAFAWQDSHLHVFDTDYGKFGIADAELGHRAEKPVTLEQVAPGPGKKFFYTYDFGDDWEHDILVEKVLDRDKTAPYPRCTGGRRAAPPDDCGGMWGYAEHLAALADPRHPEHQDRLDWIGLDDPADFDPAAFDPKEVTKALSGLGS